MSAFLWCICWEFGNITGLKQDGQAALFVEDDAPPEGVVVINSRCRLHTRNGFTVVSVAGVPIFYFAVDDEGGCAYAQVLLVGQGWADQNDVARAFERDPRTVRRNQRRFEKAGLRALGRSAGYPKGRARVAHSLEDEVVRLKSEGRATAWIVSD
jgi:hypothetical protein